MKNKAILALFLLALSIVPSCASALQYTTDRMNFQEFTPYNHTQNITNDAYYSVTVNATIPQGFTYISATGSPTVGSGWLLWTVPGGQSVTYTIQSPNQSASSYGNVSRSDIYLNGNFLDAFYFAMVRDEDIVDFKIEKGHGDSNYFYGNKDGGYPYIGNQSTALFNVIRIWNVNHLFNSTEKATNATFTCTFPNDPIMTKGRVSALQCGGSTCTVTFSFDEVTSYWWRSGVLSQQFTRNTGQNYTIACGSLTYHYQHGTIVTRPVGMSLEARNMDPFDITVSTTGNEYRFRIKNVEKYPVYDIQFDFDVDAEKEVQNLVDLQPNQEVEYVVYVDGTGTLKLTADYVPSWEKTSLKPLHHKAQRSYAFAVSPGSPNIVDIEERVIDLQSASTPFYISLDSYINRHPEQNMTSVVGFETSQTMVDPSSYVFSIYNATDSLFATSNQTTVNQSWWTYSRYLENYTCWQANCTNTSTSANKPLAPYVIRNITDVRKKLGIYLFTADLSENITILANYTHYSLNTSGNTTSVVSSQFSGPVSLFQNVTSGIFRSEVDASYNSYAKTVSKQFRVTRGIFDVGVFAENAPLPGTNLRFSYLAKNKGEFSQDVFVKYWTVINNQVVGLTEETVLAPSLTEERYQRTIPIPLTTLPGTYRVYVNLTYDSTIPTATASAEYEVVTQSTPTVTSSGGGGGSGSLSGTTSTTETDLREITLIQYPNKVDVERGDFADVLVIVKNTGKKTLSDTKISLGGIESSWYAADSSTSSLSPGETRKFIVRLAIPDYAAVKEYPLDLIVSGDEVFDSKSLILNVLAGEEKTVSLEDVAVSSLVRDERGDVFVTLKNQGDFETNVSVVLRSPNNWIADTFEYTDTLFAEEEKTYRYKVVPDQEGVYALAVIYSVQQKQYTKEVFVKVAEPFFFDPFVPILEQNQVLGGLALLALLGSATYGVYFFTRRRERIAPVIALPRQRGKTIGIMSVKGGVGKTVLVANLAAALKQLDANVLAIDGNLTNGNLSTLFGLRNVVVTLHDVIAGKIKIEQTIYRHESGVDVIPTPTSLDHERHSNIGKIIGRLKKKYDYVLIDIPTGNDEETEMMLSACDEAILVTEPTLLDTVTAHSGIEIAKRLKVPVVGIVLDKATFSNSEVPYEEIKKTTGVPLLGIIPDDENVKVSVLNQRLLVIDVPDSAASQEMYRIAECLEGAFYQEAQAEEKEEKIIQ